jgi:hypothetical protein
MWKLLKYSVIAAILLASSETGAQTEGTENLPSNNKKWTFLYPEHLKIQFAGGIGFLSAGLGYSFFKEKLDVTAFYGYVPRGLSDFDLHSVSIQMTTRFLRIQVRNEYELFPLNLGWFLHHTFGDEYWVKLPDNYPEGYYWWSPGRNAGVFVGGDVKKKLHGKGLKPSAVSLYFRLGTRGLYLASKLGNSSIPMDEVVDLGFGITIYR